MIAVTLGAAVYVHADHALGVKQETYSRTVRVAGIRLAPSWQDAVAIGIALGGIALGAIITRRYFVNRSSS